MSHAVNWKGIGFDLDNTLFSHELAFERAIEESFYTYCEEVRLPKEQVSFTAFFPLFKKNSDLFWSMFEEKKIDGTSYRRLRFNETMKALQLPYGYDLSDRFHAHYYHVVNEYSEPFTSLHELMTFLTNRKIKIFIITNGTVDTQYKKIKKLGLDYWIKKDYTIVSEEVGISKPNKEIFELAEERVGLHADELLFVGDSWKHDVVGSLNAGWDAIFLNTRNETRGSDHTPLQEFGSLENVYHYLCRLYERREI